MKENPQNIRFNKRVIDALPIKETMYKKYDSDIKGLGIRVLPTGRKTFFVQYRLFDKPDTFTIGIHGVMPVAEVLDIAADVLTQVQKGIDPKAHAKQVRGTPKVADLMQRFIKQYAYINCKPRTAKDYYDINRIYITPMLGKYRINELEPHHISKLKQDLQKKPNQANRAIAVISKAYNWAIGENMHKGLLNPCRAIRKYGIKDGVRGRQRYLTGEELSRLGAVLSRMECMETLVMYDAEKKAFDESKPLKRQYSPQSMPFVVGAIRLLLFTGARLNEIVQLKWEYVDFKKQRIELPDSKTGAKTIHLGAPALRVLQDLKKLERKPYVIAGIKKDGYLQGIQKAWQQIRLSAGITDVRIHDLRHTVASFAVSGGATLPLIGGILGHKQSATTARYSHLFEDPVKELNNRVSNTIAGEMNTKIREVK